MSIYSIAGRTSIFTAANACFTIITTSGIRATILEVGIFSASATTQTFGLGRPAAVGVGATSAVAGLAEDSSAPAASTTSCLAWTTTYPTAPTQFFRRIDLPATVGTGIIWTFPRGLIVPISGNIVIWNITLTVASDVYVVWDE